MTSLYWTRERSRLAAEEDTGACVEVAQEPVIGPTAGGDEVDCSEGDRNSIIAGWSF